jgi:hypothetical protein
MGRSARSGSAGHEALGLSPDTVLLAKKYRTVPLTKDYRTLREFLPYHSRRITVPSANFYRTTHEGLPYPPRIFTVPLGKCPAKMSCKSSTNSVGSGLALYVEVLLNVFVVYKQEF